MAERWSERQVSLNAGQVHQFNTSSKSNAIAVRVPHTTTTVYMSLDANLSLVNFETKAEPLAYGLISRYEVIKTFYLLAENSISVAIIEIYSEDMLPLLLQNLGVRQGVFITNDLRDLRGLYVNRPAASAVVIGTTYWSVNFDLIHVSDGTEWRLIYGSYHASPS